MSLSTLPIEILYHILDYLDISTIFLSIPSVCRHFRAIFNTYHCHQIDFRAVSKPSFQHICRLIQPEDIRSLTLSDGNKTPGQIQLFRSLLNLDQFTQLISLTLIGIDDENLNTFLHSNITSTLRSLAIDWREAHCPTNKTSTLLSSTLNRLELRRLELKTESYTLGDLSWPNLYTLTRLTLMYITQRQFCSILRQTPHLQALVFNHCSMHETDETTSVRYEQLKSLVMIDSRMSMFALTSILSLTTSLIYLKIICSPDSFDTMADGLRWEQFIQTNLPLLQTFEFFFTNVYNVYYQSDDILSLISRFQTPFWLEEKHWAVTCDYIHYLNQVMLYTTPLCTSDFTYECQANRISFSNGTTTKKDLSITDNVHTVNLTLTQLLTSTTTSKNVISTSRLFRNVTHLIIDIDREWSAECVQHLSTIIDLSHLEKITFNPDFNQALIENTIENITLIMTLTQNLDTLVIHPYSSSDTVFNMEDICAIIPYHIKHLEVTVTDIESMKTILDYYGHLWSLIFYASSNHSIPWSEFIEELNSRKRDFVYWESYYSLRIWLNSAEK